MNVSECITQNFFNASINVPIMKKNVAIEKCSEISEITFLQDAICYTLSCNSNLFSLTHILCQHSETSSN